MADTTNLVGNTAERVSSQIERLKDQAFLFSYEYGLQVVGALIILAAGLMVARWVGHACQRWLDGRDLELPIKSLFVKLARLLVLAFTAVMVLEKFGVPIAALVTSIGVAGVGVGLALQGVLGNLFAGLTIIFTKPFRIGEYVELAGVHGTVTHIDLSTTTLTHADLSKIVVPNRKIIGEVVHNYGEIMQLDLTVAIGYGNKPAEVLALVREILARNPRVLANPAAFVGIKSLGDSAINIAVMPWSSVSDSGLVRSEIYLTILEEFRNKGVATPLPIQEVRVRNTV